MHQINRPKEPCSPFGIGSRLPLGHRHRRRRLGSLLPELVLSSSEVGFWRGVVGGGSGAGIWDVWWSRAQLDPAQTTSLFFATRLALDSLTTHLLSLSFYNDSSLAIPSLVSPPWGHARTRGRKCRRATRSGGQSVRCTSSAAAPVLARRRRWRNRRKKRWRRWRWPTTSSPRWRCWTKAAYNKCKLIWHWIRKDMCVQLVL